MTFLPAQAVFDTRLDELTVARVQFMEAFVRLEAAITALLILHKPDFELRSHFAVKLKAIASLKSPQITPKAATRFIALMSEISTLTSIRNDMVHGIMSHVVHDGTAKAAFQNVADIAVTRPQFTIVSCDEMKANRKRILEIANAIKMFANPPSPPQPSPDAAVGP